MRRVTSGAAQNQICTQSGKLLVPLLGVLTILSVGVAVFAANMVMQERDKRQAKERELHIAQAENEDLRGRVEEIQQAKAKVEAEITRTKGELSKAQEQLAKSVESQQTLSRSVEDREREISRLMKELDQTRTESKKTITDLSEMQSERDAVKQQLADLEKAKGELETKVMELSSGERPTVELEKVLVTNGQAAKQGSGGGGVAATAQAGAPSGQVVVINREYDFIVMNLGKNNGLSVGQEFQVVRDHQVLGKVKVEKIYDELSAAAILPDSKKESIREGDTVKAL